MTDVSCCVKHAVVGAHQQLQRGKDTGIQPLPAEPTVKALEAISCAVYNRKYNLFSKPSLPWLASLVASWKSRRRKTRC